MARDGLEISEIKDKGQKIEAMDLIRDFFREIVNRVNNFVTDNSMINHV